MIDPDPDRGLRAVLDDVCGVLVATSFSDPFTSGPALRLRCLVAGERLQDVGARPGSGRTTVSIEDLTGVVIVAILVLALVADDADISTDALSDAQDALRAVLVELG